MRAVARKGWIKAPAEIARMREAGRLAHRILDELERRVAPGVSTAELNEVASRLIRQAGATSPFLGFATPEALKPFPASICASVNEELVHGIPGLAPLEAGSIVSLDVGVRLGGFCADTARTVAVGTVSPDAARLMQATRAALELAIREMRPYMRWSVVAAKIEGLLTAHGLGVVRKFVGHGIGRQMHEAPKAPNYVDEEVLKADFDLVPGMTLAVEPMATLGRPEWRFRERDGDCWTAVTRDGSLAAHFEHTVVVTEQGAEALTAA